MAFEERVQILSEAEQDELYGPPAFTSADQRFFFSLNDKELAIAKSLRHRGLTLIHKWHLERNLSRFPGSDLPCDSQHGNDHANFCSSSCGRLG